MLIAVILLLATTMAIFGILGYLKGSRWAFVSLLILLAAFILVEYQPDTVVLALNGIYTGVMLVFGGGLGALASGDFEEVQAIYSGIDPLFTDENENLALLIVIFGAVAIAVILGLIMKSKPSVWGLIWGLAYGYLLCAASFPLIISNPDAKLPVPLIRPAERPATPAAASQGPSPLDQLFTTLSQPENIQILTIIIGAVIVLLLLLTVRSGVKSGAKKKG